MAALSVPGGTSFVRRRTHGTGTSPSVLCWAFCASACPLVIAGSVPIQASFGLLKLNAEARHDRCAHILWIAYRAHRTVAVAAQLEKFRRIDRTYHDPRQADWWADRLRRRPLRLSTCVLPQAGNTGSPSVSMRRLAYAKMAIVRLRSSISAFVRPASRSASVVQEAPLPVIVEIGESQLGCIPIVVVKTGPAGRSSGPCSCKRRLC